MTDNETLLPVLNFKNISNELLDQIKNANISKEKINKETIEKIKYFHKKAPSTKLIKNNIIKKLDIYTNERKRSLLPSVYISDLRYYLSQKMNVKIKTEKSKKLMENDIQKMEYIDYEIETLKQNYSLFNKTFIHKLNKYLRELNIIKAYEKNKDEILIEKLIDIKNKVTFLQAKVKKIEINKNSLKRWIYLQICLKEKKIKLPESYKIILESKNEEKNSLIVKYGEDVVNHVMQYKNILLYKNAREFLNQFTFYENKNFELLNKYFDLKEEIRALENEKKQSLADNKMEKDEKKINESVITQTKELNRLKNENIYLEKCKKKLLFSKTETKIKENNHMEIYKNIYNKTAIILKNINLLNYNTSIIDNIYFPYQNFSENQMILNNLTKIEIIIDILIKNNTSYKKLYTDKMKTIKNLIDKEKKLSNNIEIIKKMRQKFEEERQKLIKKNNKIIILPKHKVVIDYRNNKKALNPNDFSKRRNKSVENINEYFNEF